MNYRFAMSRSDGGVSVVSLAKERPSVDEVRGFIAEWEKCHRSRGWRCVYWRQIDASAELPADEFRDAWCYRDGRVTVDMPAARELHRARIRARRAPLLAALDVEYQRADEDGDQERKRAVVARKRRLRDAPADPRIEAATTPEELAAIDPLAD